MNTHFNFKEACPTLYSMYDFVVRGIPAAIDDSMYRGMLGIPAGMSKDEFFANVRQMASSRKPSSRTDDDSDASAMLEPGIECGKDSLGNPINVADRMEDGRMWSGDLAN